MLLESHIAAKGVAFERAKRITQRDWEPAFMDPYLVMLGSLTCTMTALIFVEVRRIRKRLDKRVAEPVATKTAA